MIDLIFIILFFPARKMLLPRRKRKVRRKIRKRNWSWKLRPILACTVISMPATTRYHHVTRIDTDSETIGIDNRATACISHKADDFIGELVPTNRTIIGYNGSKTTGIKKGTIRWKWTDNEGISHVHLIPNSFYSPAGGIRLLSPQHWSQSIVATTKSTLAPTCITTDKDVTLIWGEGKFRKTIPLGENDNVATMYSSPGYEKFHAFCAQADYGSDDDADPIICQPTTSIIEDDDLEMNNRTPSLPMHQYKNKNHSLFNVSTSSDVADQLEIQYKLENRSAQLLQLHQKYGHIPFQRLKEMAKQGIIDRHHVHTPTPACAACLFGKATKRAWRHRTPINKIKTLQPATAPGERISVDMLTSPTPGLIAQMSGILTKKRYNYATVYVDNYSGYSYLHLQQTPDADETLKGKLAFELHAQQHGVAILNYHADNGIFRANKWLHDCALKQQGITFAGVNAHHQNGRAERRIRLLQELTRTQLIHLSHKWKRINAAPLWPYAMKNSNECLNHTPNMQSKSKQTSAQLFSNSEIQDNPKFRIPFGAPCYILQQPLQASQPFHKWKNRAVRGLYLGQSPLHARNISLVLNLYTGLVSPQFHVTHDTSFATVSDDDSNYQWALKAGLESTTPPTHPNKNSTSTSIKRKNTEKPVIPSKRQKIPTSAVKGNNALGNALSQDEPLVNESSTNNNSSEGRSQATSHIRSSNRIRKPTSRLITAMKTESFLVPEGAIQGEIFSLQTLFPDHQEQDFDNPLLAFKSTSDPDTLYYHEAMKMKDRREFIKAMEEEIRDNFKHNNFSVVHKSQVPEGATVLPSVWQLRRKRHIKTGAIKRYKARINVDGSRMIHNVHYTKTYAPVASWATIRLILTIALMFKWPTRQLDYKLAFPQAPIERELFMKIPKGYDIDEGDTNDYVLQLNKNLYGQKQAGRVWNKYLVQKLTKVGFKQSKYDECVFYKGKVLYVLYTDDTIITAPSDDLIDQAIQAIQSTGLEVTDEGTIEDFLGVNITRQSDNTIHLHQPHLIDQILNDLHMDKSNATKEIPAQSSHILSRHSSSAEHDKSFNYRSILGKLGYLEKGSRPDIAYIVHQCARFSVLPKIEHAKAIRWLAKYLKHTKSDGMILQPDLSRGLEMYVDADFAGNWDPDETQDIDTSRSRHGYAIKFANCLIQWKSQLQREIALSSTEAEYTGLSYAIREIIPIVNLLREIKIYHNLPNVNPKLYLKVYEDNAGAIEMANNHKYRPRTKHLNIRLHHFRKHIESGLIVIEKIPTELQQADIFTKPLPKNQFQKLRKLLLGW